MPGEEEEEEEEEVEVEEEKSTLYNPTSPDMRDEKNRRMEFSTNPVTILNSLENMGYKVAMEPFHTYIGPSKPTDNSSIIPRW